MAYVNEHKRVTDATQFGTFTTRQMKEVSGTVKVYITKSGDNYLSIYMNQPAPATASRRLAGFTSMARASHIPNEIGYMGNLGDGFPIYMLTAEQDDEYRQSRQYLEFDRSHFNY